MNKLKIIRQNLNLSKTEIAKVLGISVQRYSQYEKNSRKFPVDLAFSLCDKYDLKLEDIFLKNN